MDCNVPVRECEIQAEMTRLGGTVGSLTDSTAALAQRLDLVMRQEPSTADEGKEPADGPSAPLARQIAELRARVAKCDALLNNVLHRLEI